MHFNTYISKDHLILNIQIRRLTRLQVHQDGAGHVAAASSLVVVHVGALQLQVGVTAVGAGRVNAVLVGADLPEVGIDLVASLAVAALDVD